MLVFAVLLTAYVFCRTVLPLRLHPGWKAALGVAIAVVAFKFHLLYLIGGPMFFAPELPKLLLRLAAWLFASLFLFFFLLLAADLLRLAAWPFLRGARKRDPKKFRRMDNRIHLGILLFCLLLAGVGLGAGTALPAVREREIVCASLPPEAENLTIAVLADLHADGQTGAERIGRIVERTNAIHPDLIVIVGDFVDGTVESRAADLEPLRNLSARLGVFGVPGNHEYYSGYREWMEFLPTLGIEMLENRARMLPETGIALGGVTDPGAGRFNLPGPDPAAAFAGVPPEAFRLLLAHQPRVAPEAERAGVKLQISGHTHGGMILGVDRMVASFNAGFVSGVYRLGEMILFVTNGSSIWNGFPIRLGVPSEIPLLRLKRR